MESPVPHGGLRPGDIGPRLRGELAAAALAAAVVLCLYWWTATEGLGRTNSPGGNVSLLNQQVEAFHEGRLSLKVAPDARLLAAPNPYDPAVNRGTRLLDAALYRGKYFTYFGPVPLILFMWPWYAAFSSHAPADLIVLLLGAGAFSFQAAFLLYCKRTWFPRTGPTWLWLAITAVGAGNLFQPLLRAHSTFEVPILSELFFASAAVFFAAVAQGAGGRSLWAWSAASLSYGLAAGSRPNFIPAGAAFVLIFWLGERPVEKQRTAGEFARRLSIIAIPAALCLCGYFAYNLARFGNPLEFGNRYTLVEVDWSHRSPFSVRYALANLFYYGISVPRLSASFPYFVGSAPLPFAAPAGYLDYVDRPAGFLPAYPFVIAGIIACAGAWGAGAARGFRVMVAALVALGALMAMPLVFFIGSSLRYQAEMAFPLLLLAGLGTLCAGTAFAEPPRPAWPAAAVCALALLTVLSNFLIGCATYGYFKAANPVEYGTIAAAFDGVSYPLERSLGWEPRVPHVRLKFPSNRTGELEPIWVNGRVPEADFLYVYYVTPQAIQIGFESMGRGGPVSDLIPLDYSREHDLEIVAGPFLPIASHPYFARAGVGNGEPLPDLLRVTLDGRIVVDAIVNFYDGRGIGSWGTSEDELAFGRRFSGQPFFVSWAPFDISRVRDLFQRGNYGDVLLDLTWPRSLAARDEPLMSIGEKNRGELIFVRFDGTSFARIGIRGQDGKVAVGAPFDVSPGHARVNISMPALYPGPDWSGLGTLGLLPGRNRVSIDGRETLNEPAPSLLVGQDAVVLGRNTLLAGGIAPEFGGTIESVSRHWAGR
jgi:hypothetical protein